MTDISRGREGGYIRCLFPSGYSNSFPISTNLSPVSLTHAPIRSKQGILAAVAIADTGATHVLLRSSAAHVLHEVYRTSLFKLHFLTVSSSQRRTKDNYTLQDPHSVYQRTSSLTTYYSTTCLASLRSADKDALLFSQPPKLKLCYAIP